MIQAWSPEDPLAETLPNINSSPKLSAYEYQRKRKALHLDKPSFYFSLSSMAMPDTLYAISRKKQQRVAEAWVHQNGNWPLIQAYRQQVLKGQVQFQRMIQQATNKLNASTRKKLPSSFFNSLLTEEKLEKHQLFIEKFQEAIDTIPAFQSQQGSIQQIKTTFLDMQSQPTQWKNYIPSIHFYGWDNQYQIWLVNILTKFDFGTHLNSTQSVTKGLGRQIGFSLRFTSVSYLLGFLISILMGVAVATRVGKWQDRSVATLLYLLDAIPAFWLGTILLIFFTNDAFLNWFPAQFRSNAQGITYYMGMVLPITAYVLGMLTSLTRLMRGRLLDLLKQDFMRTARAKGLSQQEAIWRHALKPALSPMITAFAIYFPGLFTGSVIIEKIFSIPGVGDSLLAASTTNDIYQVVMFFCLTGLLTILGYLIGDILRAWVDPRVIEEGGNS